VAANALKMASDEYTENLELLIHSTSTRDAIINK
jgi:hypothetical protein